MTKLSVYTPLSICFVTMLLNLQAVAAPVLVEVQVRNLAPQNGTYLTPFWVGFHDGTFDLYNLGQSASTSLERLAEDGDTSSISTDFSNSGAGAEQGTLTGSVIPQIAPGETVRRTFTLDSIALSSRYFSYASMVIPSNDAFIANGNPTALPVFNPMGTFVGGSFLVTGGMVNDAGTEVNDELPTNTAFFGQVFPNTGVTENGVVSIHPGFNPAGTGGILDSAVFANADFKASGYQVAEISLHAIPEPATTALMATGLVWLAARYYRAGKRKS